MPVSQNISNNESTGSVSYIAKNGLIAFVKEPIGCDVDTLAIKGFVSIWYKLSWPPGAAGGVVDVDKSP